MFDLDLKDQVTKAEVFCDPSIYIIDFVILSLFLF